MDMRSLTSEYRLSHWAEIMRERQESGQSIKAYCEQTGIHENVYYYWQRKLREATCKIMESPQALPKAAPVPAGWAVYEIPKRSPEPSTRTLQKHPIEIKIGKYRIGVGTEADQTLIAAVCQTLVSLC